MWYKQIEKEINYLSTLTNKPDLSEYYYKCHKKLSPEISYSSTTQFEFEKYEGRINDLLLSFIRDYALFDEDNSDLLKKVTLNELDEDVFNCFSRLRLGD